MSSELAADYLRAVLMSDVNRGNGPGGSVISAAFGLGSPGGQAGQPPDGGDGWPTGDGEAPE